MSISAPTEIVVIGPDRGEVIISPIKPRQCQLPGSNAGVTRCPGIEPRHRFVHHADEPKDMSEFVHRGAPDSLPSLTPATWPSLRGYRGIGREWSERRSARMRGETFTG